MASVKLKPIRADLLPKKPPKFLLDIGNTEIDIALAVETKAPVSSKLDRYGKVAEKVVDDYSTIIQKEVDDLTKKMQDLNSQIRLERNEAKQKALKKQAEDLAGGTSGSVQQAVRALPAAMSAKVQATIKAEAKGDKNLTEARVAAVAKGTFTVIKVAKDITQLTVTAGADLTAWKGLAQDLYSLAGQVRDALKTEPALRNDLLTAIGKYSTEKQRRFAEKQKADKDWKKKLTLFAKEIYESVDSLGKAAEAARKKYRNEITNMRQKNDELGAKADALLLKLKAIATLKEGVKIGGELMAMKRQCKKVNDDLAKQQEFADGMAGLLTLAGVTVDDTPTIKKLQSGADMSVVIKAAGDIHTAASNLKAIVDAAQ